MRREDQTVVFVALGIGALIVAAAVAFNPRIAAWSVLPFALAGWLWWVARRA
jgi:hypothetical protein